MLLYTRHKCKYESAVLQNLFGIIRFYRPLWEQAADKMQDPMQNDARRPSKKHMAKDQFPSLPWTKLPSHGHQGTETRRQQQGHRSQDRRLLSRQAEAIVYKQSRRGGHCLTRSYSGEEDHPCSPVVQTQGPQHRQQQPSQSG